MAIPDHPPRKSRPTTITLTRELHAEMQAIADRRFTTLSQAIREACSLYAAAERERREEGGNVGR